MDRTIVLEEKIRLLEELIKAKDKEIELLRERREVIVNYPPPVPYVAPATPYLPSPWYTPAEPYWKPYIVCQSDSSTKA